jgi:hypothetical protein
MKNWFNGCFLRGMNEAKAQTTIELFLLLSISVLALAMIFSLYSQEVESASYTQYVVSAKGTIQRMVSAANTLYSSGPGSHLRVLIDIPSVVDSPNSSIENNFLILRVAGSDVIGISDINFFGDWKRDSSGLIPAGSYYAELFFDGNVVKIFYEDYELSNSSIYVSAEQGSSVQKNFSVKNNSSSAAVFWVSKSFSHSSSAVLVLGEGDDFFSLAPNESRVIDLNFSLSSYAYGNYAGYLTVVGQLSYLGVDSNIARNVYVSIESFLALGDLVVYPNNDSFSAVRGSSYTRSFSVCNFGLTNFTGLSWEKASSGSGDNNVAAWFSLPGISSLDSGTCTDFNLSITVPPGSNLGSHDGNMTVFQDTNAFTSSLTISVDS